MKKTLLTLAVAAVSALTVYGQGRVNFNNYVSGSAVTVDPLNMGPIGGATGANVGANYSVQVLYAGGTFADITSFLAASPLSSTPVAFFGATGGSPGTDGAGLFDGGTVAVGPAGTYTMLIRAWYNGGQYATYDAAFGSANTGQSLFSVSATAAPTPAPNTTFAPFTVGIVPEPTSLALVGLGAISFLALRRKK